MRIWFALIMAPVFALTDQAVAFALVGWSCTHQNATPVHASHVICLAITAASTFAAWQAWRATAVVAGGEEHAGAQRHFLAGVATAVAALSAAAVAAMWLATWMISPCLA